MTQVGGTTLVDDVDGLAEMISGLKQGCPPKTTAKTSHLRKLALKRSELWCRSDPTQDCSVLQVVGPEVTSKQTLFGKEALYNMLKKTTDAVQKNKLIIWMALRS